MQKRGGAGQHMKRNTIESQSIEYRGYVTGKDEFGGLFMDVPKRLMSDKSLNSRLMRRCLL